MPDSHDSELLIGVDGGASEVKAHQVLVLSEAGPETGATRFPPSLALGGASASLCYDLVPGFAPVKLAEQLEALREKRVVPTPMEIAEGDLWIDAIAHSIHAIAVEAEEPHVRLGLCMPGLKTSDGRGLAAVRHGPRIPDFLDRLERRLARDGLVLAQPIARMISDGDACGLGERVHAQGILRGITNAYYIGGGTGLAETLLLAGEVVSFDALSGWMEKAWALESAQGGTFEEHVSMGGINAAYARRRGHPLPVQEDEFPEKRALRGDPVAIEVMRAAAEALAELVFLRLALLSKGRKPATPLPQKALVSRAGGVSDETRSLHMRPHTFLDRIVFGQRLAHLFADEALHRVFRDVVEAALARRIHAARDELLAVHYLTGTNLKPDFLCASSLRAAPALGAAAWALEAGARRTVQRPREKLRPAAPNPLENSRPLPLQPPLQNTGAEEVAG
jgi:predicted NBD/HSP70 family sugar kinase